jgi:hypothetical protein
MDELDRSILPYLENELDYRACCSVIWHLNHGCSFAGACKKASARFEVPAARIERIIRASLPENYFFKRQRAGLRSNPQVYKNIVMNAKHFQSI